MLRRLLLHDSLPVRFAALLGLGLILFYVSWIVAYALLPEAVLRGKSGAAVLAGTEAAPSLLFEFIRIAAINMAIAGLFIVLPNRLLQIDGYPLGYLPPLLWFVHYGLLLGTNSFSVPMPEPLAPSWTVLARSGLYEIGAYCLIAASTHSIAVARSPRLFSFASEPVRPRPPFLAGVHKAGLGWALAVLLVSNLWEAYRIVS